MPNNYVSALFYQVEFWVGESPSDIKTLRVLGHDERFSPENDAQAVQQATEMLNQHEYADGAVVNRCSGDPAKGTAYGGVMRVKVIEKQPAASHEPVAPVAPVGSGPIESLKRNLRPIPEAKTKKGPHGGGNEFDELKINKEFKNLAKNAPQEKSKPKDGDEATIDPGDGAKLGSKAPAANTDGLKKVGKDLQKKSKPGKSRPNEALDSAIDAILSEAIGPNPVIRMKEPEILGVLGAPSHDQLDAQADGLENGLDCDDCMNDPNEVPEEHPGVGSKHHGPRGGSPQSDFARRLAALGDFDEWMSMENDRIAHDRVAEGVQNEAFPLRSKNVPWFAKGNEPVVAPRAVSKPHGSPGDVTCPTCKEPWARGSKEGMEIQGGSSHCPACFFLHEPPVSV